MNRFNAPPSLVNIDGEAMIGFQNVNYERYNPMDYKEIPFEFAKIADPTKKIEDFINSYGIPGVNAKKYRKIENDLYIEETPELMEEQLSNGEPVGEQWIFDSIEDIRKAADDVSELINLMDEIKKHQIGKLKRRWNIILQSSGDNIVFFSNNLQPDLKAIPNEKEVYRIARKHLADELNGKLYGRVDPYVGVDADGNFLPMFVVRHLIDAIYFHLYNDLTNRESLRRCKHCGSLFLPTRKNQETCPKPPNYAKSPCLGQYESKIMYRKRKVRKLHKEGFSIEQIAQEIEDVSIDEIKQWIGKE